MQRTKVYVCRFGDRSTLQLQWRDPETRRLKTRSAKTDNEKAAEQAAKELEYELNHGLHVEPSKVTWERFVELFEEEHLGGLRPRSAEKYVEVLDSFEKAMSPTRLSDVTDRTLSRYVVALRERGASPATVQTHLVHMKAALSWGVEQKFLIEMPKVPRVNVPDKLPHKISDEDFRKLLDACPSDMWRAFLLAAWYTGMRRNELLAMTWFDVDFEGERITVQAETSKGKRDDWIPMHSELATLLRGLQRESGRVFEFGCTPRRVTGRFAVIANRAGVECSLHDLRRSFGSRYAPHVPAPVLQRLMRHRNIQTTLKFYANVDDSLHAAIAKVS